MSASDMDLYIEEDRVGPLNLRGREGYAVMFMFAAGSSRIESKGSGAVVATPGLTQVPISASCAKTAVRGHFVTKPRSSID